MSGINIDKSERQLLDLNEYGFYYFMPDSEAVQNKLGFFLKNNSIETYSYISPTPHGEENFDQFLDFAFSFFSDGKDYFIVKHYNNDNFMKNSKMLRQRKLIPYHLDTSLMIWKDGKRDKLSLNSNMELELINSKEIKKWVDVFFDSFTYPKYLQKYITNMVTIQEQNGIKFYVGYVSGRDISCFCAHKSKSFYGIYGVGTRLKYRRQGYAKNLMSNYIDETIMKDSKAKFCLQAQKNTGAENLYLGMGFDTDYVQKRFDWDPSILDSSF